VKHNSLQAAKQTQEVIQDNVELLLECFPLRMRWEPVTQFLQLGGLQLLMKLIAMATSWGTYTGK